MSKLALNKGQAICILETNICWGQQLWANKSGWFAASKDVSKISEIPSTKIIKILRARRMIRLLPEQYDLNRPLVREKKLIEKTIKEETSWYIIVNIMYLEIYISYIL